MNIGILRTMALALFFWTLTATGGDYLAPSLFPAQPGQAESLYVVYSDQCGESPPTAPPTLRPVEGAWGWWRLEIALLDLDSICLGVPPGDSTALYAFEIPPMIEGEAVLQVDVVSRRFGQVVSGPHTLEIPYRWAMPPTIAGTWRIPGHDNQGMMLQFTDRVSLAVHWATFDRTGKPLSLSGVGRYAGSRITVPLFSVPSGTFAGTDPVPVAAQPWGELELEYGGCDHLEARWMPDPSTGLPAGNAVMHALTKIYQGHCDLTAYAGFLRLVKIAPVVVPREGDEIR